MKDRIQIVAFIMMLMLMTNVNAGEQFLTSSNDTSVAPSRAWDSLQQLKKNYPPVYHHLLRQFRDASSLRYSVEGNTILISFTCNSQKILTVYSTAGEFRHSITDIGFALPQTVKDVLTKEYPSYSVYHGKEIRTGDKNIYQVVIENKDEYRLVNFLDMYMEEVRRIKK